MQRDTILYIAYSVTSIDISVLIAILFWHRSNVAGARCMSLMMYSAALWGLCDFLSDLCVNNSIKIYWESASYVGITVIPVLWMIFVLQFTENEVCLTRKKIGLMFIIPLITNLMAWTNGFHHLLVTQMSFVRTGQITVLDPTFGAWFWVHAVYSYSLFLLGTVLLVKKLLTLPSIMRSQSIVMFVAILIPLIMNILYTFKVNPAYPIDPTIFSFTCTGILCFIGMFRYKLFELIPLARNAVVEDMSVLLIALDNQNHIIDINSAAKSFFDITEKNFIGKLASDLLGPWHYYFVKYEDALEVEEKLSINTNDGIRHFDLRITPLIDHRDKIIGRFFILYDITAIEEAIVDLEESRKLAEDASKAKSQFLATMSHEIRTPLGGIIGMTELLTSANLTEEEKGYLQTVQSCAASLLDIINDILDFSKIEAGRMELEKTDVNLKHIITGIVSTFFHKAKDKGIELLSNVDDSIPETLVGDPVRLKQILINLIGNAFKFTEKGKVEIRVRLLDHEDQQVNVQFSVIDTGIGVPEDKIDNLFKSFQQVDSSTTRKYGGTGLGLAIVKDLVDMMGGYIKVESRLGGGSTFTFTIPFRISDKETHDDTSDREVDFTGRDISILLTEDSKVNQMLIAKILEKKGIKADIAGNGRIALRMLQEKAYDLVLMDIQMPEMDGYEATAAIRGSEAGTKRHIPIIALTANATESDKKECVQAGMDDFLTKPIKTKKLYECIYRHIGNAE